MKTFGLTILISAMVPIVVSAEESQDALALGERESLLKVEDFSPKSGGFTLNYGLTYSSQDNNGYLPGIVHVLAPNGSIVLMPAIQETGDRSDSLIGNIGARYNVNSLLNISAQVSGGLRHDRLTDAAGVQQAESAFDFNSLALGADIRLTPATSRLYANAFVSVGTIEKNASGFDYGKSLTAGVTGYWVADPLIFSNTITYTALFDRETARGDVDPGDVLTVTPTVGFAVNPDINLSWGMGFAVKQGDRLEGQALGDWDMLSTVNFGVGYRLSEDFLLNVNGRAGVAGNDAVQFGVNVSQRF